MDRCLMLLDASAGSTPVGLRTTGQVLSNPYRRTVRYRNIVSNLRLTLQLRPPCLDEVPFEPLNCFFL
jgi:hypothetical protein